MKKKKLSKGSPQKKPSHPEAKGLFLLAFTLLTFLSLLSFVYKNPSQNWLGIIGYSLAHVMQFFFGMGSYLLVLYLMWCGWKLLSSSKISTFKHMSFLLFLSSLCMLLNIFAETHPELLSYCKKKVIHETVYQTQPTFHVTTRYILGGVPYYFLYRDLPWLHLRHLFSDIGVTFICISISVISFFFLTGIHIKNAIKVLVNGSSRICSFILHLLSRMRKKPKPLIDRPQKSLSPLKPSPVIKKMPMSQPPTITVRSYLNEAHEKLLHQKKTTTSIASAISRNISSYHLPSPSLLATPQHIDQPIVEKELKQQALILQKTLENFGISARVGDIHCGPTIALFEVHPSIGVKVQKIKALENDIALNMQAKSIRIIAPIPGKAAVGVEVPALFPQQVSFKEMLLGYQTTSRHCNIPILLGKTVSGDNVIADLSKMPHLLIAGATGSGKSVCINTIVMSIVMNAPPEKIRLMMIDPKKVELTNYSHLPHMIAPVITESHGAYAALHWLVREMQNRYEIFKHLRLRNITSFNALKKKPINDGSFPITIPDHMPFIVAIIDEFADLMMVSSTDLETPIARIAQMARAVGIHLILATQRPSREVITGIIKANFPSRVAFKVASRINSQIILDENGAENLLGNGDLLFLPPGSSHLVRAQGAFISDEEINRIVSHISEKSHPQYLIPSFDALPKEEILGKETSGRDELYDQALHIVLSTRTASTTFLQRKLKIGYARAASLMDELQEKGIIGPQEGSKPRRVLANQEELF
ncbi:MAG: DNA translocase FtsK 4TM domain-containing protein [Parachlamydiales bacterium]|nr:DNA translocase FtsK 4TM domain-containing protein [Parachlamydiales bacterium]